MSHIIPVSPSAGARGASSLSGAIKKGQKYSTFEVQSDINVAKGCMLNKKRTTSLKAASIAVSAILFLTAAGGTYLGLAHLDCDPLVIGVSMGGESIGLLITFVAINACVFSALNNAQENNAE